jgi:hypothetical protein
METDGHELGAHAHSIIQLGPTNWSTEYGELTNRYGMPVYNDTCTQRIWNDVTFQLDRLTHNKHTICACAFLCSTEGQLAQQFGYLMTPGDRSEKCLDYTGQLMHHPFRCGTNNHRGYELQEDFNSPIIYLDHYAQIGNTNAHSYNCTFPYMAQEATECYQDWLSYESTNKDSNDYHIWTFGFLTHLWLINEYYLDQIQSMLDFLDSNYINHYTANGNLIAHYATAYEIGQEFIAWEQTHPGWSSFNLIYPYPDNLKISEIYYKPESNNEEEEWLEIFNPTELVYDLTDWDIRGAVFGPRWCFVQGTIAPGEYKVVAHNGQVFYDIYGFYPDFEASGGTPAIDVIDQENLEFHDLWDAVILQDTTRNAPETELDWADIYSWGQSWCAGFCDTTIIEDDHSIARDSSCTDTDEASDWSQDGRDANNPTPGQQNLEDIYPQPVTCLTVSLQGDDTILSWCPVDSSLMGTPIIVDNYNIYYSLQPYPSNSSLVFLASTTDTTFVHTDALLQNETLYYQVKAYWGGIDFSKTAK